MDALALARAMLLVGHYTEALLSAEKAFGQDPTSRDAYGLAQTALLGLDRPHELQQLHLRAQRVGVTLPERTLAVAYVGGAKETRAATLPVRKSGTESLAEMEERGAFLDGMGRLSEGKAVWREAARAAHRRPGFASSGAFLLAEGALNRALSGRCLTAMQLGRESAGVPKGTTATLRLGLVDTLCGATEKAGATRPRRRPQETASRAAAGAVMRSAVALAGRDPVGDGTAISKVQPSRDELPLLVYLRGLAHVAAQERSLATSDLPV